MATVVTNFTYLIVMLAIITNGVQCSVLKNQETIEPSPRVCQKMHDEYYVLPGSGVKSIYRPYILQENLYKPIAKDSSTEFAGSNFTIYINHADRACNFSFDNRQTEVWTNYQVSPTKLYFCANQRNSSQIISVDLSTCSSKDVSKNLEPRKWRFYYWIYHEDGFEAIFENDCNKTRVSYDKDGNQIGQPRPFYLKYGCFKAIPLSKNNPRSSNLIAIYQHKGNYYVSLINADGRLIKHLLTFDFDQRGLWIGENYDYTDSVFSYCWAEPNLFNCAQFDQFGNEIFRNSTKNANSLISKPVGVSKLRKGGVVLVTMIKSKSDYHVVEMRYGRIIEKTYPSTNHSVRTVYVTDFNEADRQFTIREEITKSDRQMCWYNFFLPSKFE